MILFCRLVFLSLTGFGFYWFADFWGFPDQDSLMNRFGLFGSMVGVFIIASGLSELLFRLLKKLFHSGNA